MKIGCVRASEIDFSKYGKFFDLNNKKGDVQVSSGDGWTDCLIRKPVIDTPANLGYTMGSGIPFTTKELEHHSHTQEALFCQNEPIVFLVCEVSDSPCPEAEKTQAIILYPGEVAVLNRDVWHSSAHGINGPTHYFYLAYAYDGEPTEWVNIKDGPIEVEL